MTASGNENIELDEIRRIDEPRGQQTASKSVPSPSPEMTSKDPPNTADVENGTSETDRPDTSREPPIAFSVTVYLLFSSFLIFQITLFIAYLTSDSEQHRSKEYRLGIQMTRPGPNFATLLLHLAFGAVGYWERSPLRKWLGDKLLPHYVFMVGVVTTVEFMMSLVATIWKEGFACGV